jgi:hypothetical protein
MTKARGRFQVTSRHEDTYEELEGGAKLTRARGEQTFAGDLEGDGTVQWLMWYPGDGTARFVGLWHLTGAIGGRKGSFVMDSRGDFDGAASKGSWTIVAGSGTGELEGIRGDGGFEASRGSEASYELEVELG